MRNMPYDFKGKVALITGGAKGIGLSCAQELLRNGIQGVTVVDIDMAQGSGALKCLSEEFGDNRAIFLKGDVTKLKELKAAFETTLEKWNAIDIIINNAGILNDAHWELEISINCGGVVRGTLLGYRYMGRDKGGNGGVIVNIASNLGLQAISSCPVYVASKHFVVGLGRSLGTPYHYNRTGVKILTTCPGATDTALCSEAEKNPFTKLDENIHLQPTEIVGRGVVAMIKGGDSGNFWLVSKEKMYEVSIPEIEALPKQEKF